MSMNKDTNCHNFNNTMIIPIYYLFSVPCWCKILLTNSGCHPLIRLKGKMESNRIKTIKIKHLLMAAAICIQLIWYGIIMWHFKPDPHQPTDFIIFYTAGRIAATGRYDLIYDLEAQRAVHQELLGVPLAVNQFLPFNHPPMFVPLIQLIAGGNYTTSYWGWVAILAAFLVAAMIVFNRLLQAEKMEAGSRWLLILVSVLFYPLFISLFRGQDSVIVFLGVMLWMYGLLSNRDALSGAGLALAVLRPQVALMLAIPFLVKRRKVWWWFCGFASLLAIYSLLLVGWNGVRDFFFLIGVSAQGQWYGMEQRAMLNFTGLVMRLFPQGNLNIIHTVAWGLFCVGLAMLSIWWKRSPEIRLRQIVVAVTFSVFAAPHLFYHDLTLLLIPCLGVGLAAIRANRLKIWEVAGLLTIVSFSLMVSVFWKPIYNILPYLWMAVLVWAVWQYETG